MKTQSVVPIVCILTLTFTLASSSQSHNLGWKEPGQTSYFDAQLETLSRLKHAKDLSQGDNVALGEMTQLWYDLTAPLTQEVEAASASTGGFWRSQLYQAQQQRRGILPPGLYPGVLSPLVNSLLDALDNANTSSRCMNDTGRTVVGMFAGEKWTLPFLDASGKPGPSLMEGQFNLLGNYEECRKIVAPPDNTTNSPGFGGTYAVALGKSDPNNPYAPVIQLGICVADTCNETELTELLIEVLHKVKVNTSTVSVTVQIRDSHREITTATVLAIVVLSVIGLLVLVGTLYDLLVVNPPQWSLTPLASVEEGQDGDLVPTAPGEIQEQTPLLPKVVRSEKSEAGTLSKVLMAFSAYTNGAKVLNTHQPQGSLRAINGIRFLSMTWVILGHTVMVAVTATDNPTKTLDYLSRWTFTVISNATFSVDTFFTMSGLLTAYLTFKEMKRKGWKINWGLFYFHRFWRLTPPYMLALLLCLGLQRFFGYGELWDNVQPADKITCEKNWWTNLLYINNIVRSDEMCFGHTWYLANDMQFFVVSPLLIIPFYFNAYLGLASCLTFLLTTMSTAGALSVQNNWRAAMVSLQMDAATMSYFSDYYIKPWCRIGPYVVGVMAGYLLAATPGRIRMRWYTVVCGWAVSIATGLAIIYGIYGEIAGTEINDVHTDAFYNAVSRTAWGACVCWVIVACASGYGGFVNTLLSWPPFVPLGRMTYMAYLIHLNILATYAGNRGALFHLNDLNLIVMYLGVLMLSYMVAFVLMLGLESPMIGLEKTFLPQKKRN